MDIIDINNRERECLRAYPDPNYPGFMRIQFKRYHEWYTIAEFIELNPKLKHLTKNAPKLPEDVVGVVTSSGKNFLSDTSQKWQPNSYLGFFAWVSRGKGEGQKRTVVKNTKTIVYIDQEWDVKPDKTSQYVISHNIHETEVMGNTLPQEDMKKLEERARKMDIERGLKPAPRQYTKK